MLLSKAMLKAYQLQDLLIVDHFKNVEIELLDTNQPKEYLAKSGEH